MATIKEIENSPEFAQARRIFIEEGAGLDYEQAITAAILALKTNSENTDS